MRASERREDCQHLGRHTVNKAMAVAKYAGKDVDWDQLSENALSLRWLFIDECSTLSPSLLATLESFLRDKACLQHPLTPSEMRRRSNTLDSSVA